MCIRDRICAAILFPVLEKSDQAYPTMMSLLPNGLLGLTFAALIAAIVSSGLPTDRFIFEGFLPPKKGRKKRLMNLVNQDATIIFYESPYRLIKTLEEINEIIGNRPAVIARELTKLHEDVRRAEISELYNFYKGITRVRGEIVFLISPPEKEALYLSHDQIKKLLKDRFANETLKDAVRNLAREHDICSSLV